MATFQVKSIVDPQRFKAEVSYSTAGISEAMAEQAGLFADYGVMAARAAKQVNDLELLLENAEAKVYRLVRDNYAKSGDKVTEARLEKEVSVHPAVVSLKRALNEAKQIEAQAKIFVEAFRHRKDMLIQEGAQQRKEMDGETYVSARNVREDIANREREYTLQRLKAIREQNGAVE